MGVVNRARALNPVFVSTNAVQHVLTLLHALPRACHPIPYLVNKKALRNSLSRKAFFEWRISGSNRRPSECHSDALPAELIPHFWCAVLVAGTAASEYACYFTGVRRTRQAAMLPPPIQRRRPASGSPCGVRRCIAALIETQRAAFPLVAGHRKAAMHRRTPKPIRPELTLHWRGDSSILPPTWLVCIELLP